MFGFRSMVSKFAFWSVVLLATMVIAAMRATWNDPYGRTHDFNYWQGQYKTMAADLADSETVKQAAMDTPVIVQQVTVLQFPTLEADGTSQQRVDRCQSCHIGLNDPNMTAENIIWETDHKHIPTDQIAAYLTDPAHAATLEAVKTLGAHPGTAVEAGAHPHDLGVIHSGLFTYGITTEASQNDADKADYAIQKTNLKQHPFPTWGCTTCHYGTGRELIQANAHGSPEHSLTPLLPAKYMQAACAQCHSTYDSKTFNISYLPQMTTIAHGEQLFKQQACYGCHKIEGFSKGNIGPELTYEGRAAGGTTAIAHQIWDPRYKVAACVMPYFFSVRAQNTDLPIGGVIGSPLAGTEVVDPRIKTTVKAPVATTGTPDYIEDVDATLRQHGYIPDAARQADVDALVTFVASQTGQNYGVGQASHFTTVAAYNLSVPSEVPVTAVVGKQLFASSGCYACHYIGDPNKAHITGDPKFGQGGIMGPELSWEGTRHSQQWLVAHYKNPQAFVPGSIMPIFPFSNSQRAALSLYDAAQRPAKSGARPVSPDQDMPKDYKEE